MKNYEDKIKIEIINFLKDYPKPNILELGVNKGVSTKLFLDLCKKNNGKLFSVDIKDCSAVSNDPNWTFIKSADDNIDDIKSKIPAQIDILFIDTVHEAQHVEKILHLYFDLVKKGGYIFIDDISHLPYLKNNIRDSFYCEINNQETFRRILEIYNGNIDNFDLSFSYSSSGIAILKKLTKNHLNKKKVITERKFSLKNLLRKLFYKFRKLT